jgi:N-acetylglutamate synthase-like GNAT family acetyltransferase
MTAPAQGIEVRFATEDDVHAYQALCAKVIKHNYLLQSAGFNKNDFDEEKFFSNKSKEYYRSLITKQGNRTILLIKDRQIAGGISIIDHENFFELANLAVIPDLQGQGLGLKLLDEANKVIGKGRAKAYECVNAWGAINTYFTKGFLISPRHSIESVHPQWLNSEKELLQYHLIKPAVKNNL